MLYDDIEELPIRLWFKINKTNDYSLLIKKGKATTMECGQAWEKLMAQYVEEVGVGETYKELIDARRKLAMSQIDYHVTGDEFHLNFIRIHEEEVKSLELETTGDYDNYDTIISIERLLNIQIDENKCSVKKFFTYLKEAKAESERIEMRNYKENGNN